MYLSLDKLAGYHIGLVQPRLVVLAGLHITAGRGGGRWWAGLNQQRSGLAVPKYFVLRSLAAARVGDEAVLAGHGAVGPTCAGAGATHTYPGQDGCSLRLLRYTGVMGVSGAIVRMRGSSPGESVPGSVSDHTDTVKIIILRLTLRVSVGLQSITICAILTNIPGIDSFIKTNLKLNRRC